MADSNEVCGKESSLRLTLKADSQEEKLQKWREHFKNVPKNLLKSQIKIFDKSLMANQISKSDVLLATE